MKSLKCAWNRRRWTRLVLKYLPTAPPSKDIRFKMKYVPSEESEEINAQTEKNPFLSVVILVVSAVVVYVVFLLTLALVGETLAVNIPAKYETKIFSFMDLKMEKKPWDTGANIVNDMFKSNSIDDIYKPEIFYSCDPTVNAIALPGKKIIVFKGLLSQIKSMNALYFIIGHEVGHILHRDHLKSIGRALAVSLGLFFVNVGGESNSFFSLNNAIVDRQFSQHQEEDSDNLAIEYTVRRFKGLNRSHEFFDYINGEEGQHSKYANFLSTHPITQTRIDKIKNDPRYNSDTTVIEEFDPSTLACP